MRVLSYNDLRTYDDNHRPPGLTNRYCPRCRCSKSGHRQEPNPVTEACDDRSCACHEETP